MPGSRDSRSPSGWRLTLAQRIAAAYAADANARVVMIAGSTGRGAADRWSDIEVDVYYDEPPTEESRRAAAAASSGTLVSLGEDHDEWEERLDFDGFHAHSSTFLVSTMERYLDEVLERWSTASEPQSRLFSLQHAVGVKGEEDVQRWRGRAAAYPDGLRDAMLAENLGALERFHYAAEMLADRDDVLLLYDLFVDVGRRLIGALLGLNRIYLPTPTHPKWMDETISMLAVKPADLSARLKNAFRVEPAPGVAALGGLIDEVLALVESQAPRFDTRPYRRAAVARRTPWERPPPGLA